MAFLAVLAAVGSGYQAAIMAPTEILAEQHHANLRRLLDQMEAIAPAGGARCAALRAGECGRGCLRGVLWTWAWIG